MGPEKGIKDMENIGIFMEKHISYVGIKSIIMI